MSDVLRQALAVGCQAASHNRYLGLCSRWRQAYRYFLTMECSSGVARLRQSSRSWRHSCGNVLRAHRPRVSLAVARELLGCESSALPSAL